MPAIKSYMRVVTLHFITIEGKFNETGVLSERIYHKWTFKYDGGAWLLKIKEPMERK